MWPWQALVCCILLGAQQTAMASDACGPASAAIQPIHILIDEARLADALALFNNLGADIRADSIPATINLTHKLYHGQSSYFDTPDLALLEAGKALQLHQKIRYKTQTPVDITFMHSDGDSTKFEAKNYRRKLTPLDKHPLVGQVKRSERETFLTTMKAHQIADPLSLRPVLSHSLNRKRFVIRKHTSPILQIGFNSIESYAFGMGFYLYEIEIAQKECAANLPLSPMEQEFIKNIAKDFKQQLLARQIGHIVTSNPYQRYWQRAQQVFPLIDLTTQHPLLIKLIQTLILAVIGGLILGLILSRQRQKDRR